MERGGGREECVGDGWIWRSWIRQMSVILIIVVVMAVMMVVVVAAVVKL